MGKPTGRNGREHMSQCGQRASFNPFGVERVKRRGRHAPLRRCRFWDALNLRSGIRARIASVLRAARTGAGRAARTARGLISSGFLAERATEASRGRDSGSISMSAGATVSHRELKLS